VLHGIAVGGFSIPWPFSFAFHLSPLLADVAIQSGNSAAGSIDSRCGLLTAASVSVSAPEAASSILGHKRGCMLLVCVLHVAIRKFCRWFDRFQMRTFRRALHRSTKRYTFLGFRKPFPVYETKPSVSCFSGTAFLLAQHSLHPDTFSMSAASYPVRSYHGSPDLQFPYCHAVFWYSERVKRESSYRARKVVYNGCCKGGKVSIPPFLPRPEPLT